MNSSNEFRPVNDIEYKLITKSISNLSKEVLHIFQKLGFKLFKLKTMSKSKIFLVPPNILLILNDLKNINKIIYAGVYFGFLKGGGFFLSLEGAEFLHNLNPFSEDKIIIVNFQGEKSILYGNKITKEMIKKVSLSLEKGQFLLIFNQDKQLISIALSQVNYSTFKKLDNKALIALNLKDKGYYLRKKQ
ncbi:MAG: hypothetical protein ACTSQJ_09280 [Promethearchaeota archaeon]